MATQKNPKYIESIEAAYNATYVELSNALKSNKHYEGMRKLKRTFFSLQGMAKSFGIKPKQLPRRSRNSVDGLFDPAVSNVTIPKSDDKPNNSIFDTGKVVGAKAIEKSREPNKPNNSIFENAAPAKVVPAAKKKESGDNGNVLADNAKQSFQDEIKEHQDKTK